MRTPAPAVLLLAAVLAGTAMPARGEMGPCKPDRFDGLTCGAGPGAARVIDGTRSPDKRLAFAWRDPKGEPGVAPDDDATLEFLLVRLDDGAVLATSKTGYWNTGDRRADRLEERAMWSPDGRLVARVYQSRFDTERLELYAVGAKDEPLGMLDLRKIVEPRVRARLRDADPAAWAFAVAPGNARPMIGNAGLMRLPVMLWMPKRGPMRYFDLDLRIGRDRRGDLAARITSIRKARERR